MPRKADAKAPPAPENKALKDASGKTAPAKELDANGNPVTYG